MRRLVPIAFAASAALSCSGLESEPRAEPVSLRRVAPAVADRFCIRGEAGVGQSRSGTITASDCDDSAGHYETYLVSVATPREVTFAVDSDFDSFLALVEVVSFSDTDYNGVFLAHDDDSNGGEDARLVRQLQPGVTYAVMVSGLRHREVGNYTLSIH